MRCLESDYFLLHAFDRLGRHLFDHDWTGREFRAREVPSPDDVAAQQADLELQLAALNTAIEDADQAIARSVDAEEILKLKEKKEALITERAGLRTPFYQFPSAAKSLRLDWECFQRRTQTENSLFSALKAERLKAETTDGMIIDWPAWERERGFRCYLDLSMVRVPPTRSSVRRYSVLLRREPFEDWLKTILPIAPSALADIDPKDRCRVWLIEIATPQAQPIPKPMALEQAQALFPGLAKRAFDRVWASTVPAHWQKPGRRKAVKN